MIDKTTSIGILVVVASLAWWVMSPSDNVAPEPSVVVEPDEADAGSPGSVFQAGALVREGRVLVGRANATLDRFEQRGVIVKPADPAVCGPTGCPPMAYSVAPRRRILFRRRR